MSRTASSRRSRARRGEGDRLRAEILDATARLLDATGDADAVSIRAIAHEVGCTPPSIYLHFADKAQLLREVCRTSYEAVMTETARAAASIDDPVEALKVVGRGSVRAGLEHPERYRVLFMERHPADVVPIVLAQIDDLPGFDRFVAAAQRCIDAGVFPSRDAVAVACVVWSVVHGVTSILITEPRFPWPERERAIETCLDAVCAGLRLREDA